MNPFLFFLPSLDNISESDLEALYDHPLEEEIRNVIRENNSLTYFTDLDRFPNIESLRKTLKDKQVLSEEKFLPLLIWIMAYSYMIVPIYFIDKPSKLEDYHYVDSQMSNIERVKNYFFEKITKLYKHLHGKIFIDNYLQNIVFVDPLFYNFRNQDEYLLYQYAKVYQILKEFFERVENNPDFMSTNEISFRKRIAIQRLKERYRFLKKRDQNQKALKEQKEEKESLHIVTHRKPQKEPQRRAIDDPRWKQVEQSPYVDWNMIFRTFGTNMVIRILLRRQDYGLLKKMIEGKRIYKKEDLIYILEGMKKIQEHHDLKIEKMNEYEELKEYIHRIKDSL